jgi:hypothetical protein
MHDYLDYLQKRLQERPHPGRIDLDGGYHSPNEAYAGIGAYLAQLMLNVTLKNTASFVSPGSIGLALCTAAPTSAAISEVATGLGYTAQPLGIGSVGAAGTQASNSASVAFGPVNTALTISGVVVKDTLATAGNILYFGLLSAVRTLASGDSLSIAAGALTISLA